MTYSKYDILNAMRQKMDTDEAFTHPLDTPRNEGILAVASYITFTPVEELKVELQEFFDQEAENDQGWDAEYNDMIEHQNRVADQNDSNVP